MAAHKHAELIKAWADGAEIEFLINKSQGWREVADPAWAENIQYRIKPAEPEREPYPETLMTSSQLNEYYENTPSVPSYASENEEALVWVVNRALRHACDAGQIVTRAEFDRAVGDRQKRDMAVAEAVQKEVQNQANARCLWVDGYRVYFNFSLDLRSFIDTVK